MTANTFLFGTAIVGIFSAKTISGILSRNHTSALTAPSKLCKRKMVWHFLHARTRFFRKHFLDCFKQCRRNNWHKASVVIFALVIGKTEIYAIGEHTGDGSFGRWRSFRRYAVIRQKVGDSAEGVRPFGVFLKRFYHNARFSRMRFDIPRFRIVYIAKGSEHQPLASTDFLADTTRNILNEIVAVILTLSARHLQHKFPLLSWLKPKCRKTQRNDFGRVYCINDAPTVNTIASKSIGMPRENTYAVHRINAGHHFVKKFTTRFLCAFRLLKFLKNFKIFFTRIFMQFKKLCLNRHYLVVIILC